MGIWYSMLLIVTNPKLQWKETKIPKDVAFHENYNVNGAMASTNNMSIEENQLENQ